MNHKDFCEYTKTQLEGMRKNYDLSKGELSWLIVYMEILNANYEEKNSE